MKKAHGLRRYLYEFIYAKAVERARAQAAEVVPISQAKKIRARVDEILTEQHGQTMGDPNLGITPFLTAVDAALAESVRGYEPQFGDHGPRNERFLKLQAEFVAMTGVNHALPPKSARLPVSPYDPAWAGRSTVKRAGTALTYLRDETIQKATGGAVQDLHEPRYGNMTLYRAGDHRLIEAGRAMSYEDASGLTALMDKMSEKELNDVRDWVIDGGRDRVTGHVDRSRFMGLAAVARSVAVLEDLKSQGIAYEISKDRNPGQIKARVLGTGLEIRLTDTRRNEDYAGARVYDNGVEIRYSTNVRTAGNKTASYSPTPEEAVQLLRFAQGQALVRQDSDLAVGQVGQTHPERGRGNTTVQVPDAYHVGKGSMFTIKDYVSPGQQTARPGAKVMLLRNTENRSLPTFFSDAEAAETYTREAVESARVNLVASLDVDGLLRHHHAQVDQQPSEREPQFGDGAPDLDPPDLDPPDLDPPVYSSDPEVAAIQRAYWDVLTGHRDQLLRPGATEEMFQARIEAIGELQAGELQDGVLQDGMSHAGEDLTEHLGNLVYGGTPEEKIRAHAQDVADELIGTVVPEPHYVDGEFADLSFDPVRVAKYMTSATGQWSSLDNLAAALRKLGRSPAEMLGTGFQNARFKDRLVQFDQSTARELEQHEDRFLQQVGRTVRDALQHNAVTVTGEILIDGQGIIRWSGEKLKRSGEESAVTGQIGQVFSPGKHGEIITRFASGDNALIVPGYEARIVAGVVGRADGETRSVEERTRLRGYEQQMLERIRYQVAGDVMAGRSEVGEATSLNGVYSQLYGTKHPVDFLERAYRLPANLVVGTPNGLFLAGSDLNDLAAADYDTVEAAEADGKQVVAWDQAWRYSDQLDPWTEAIVRTEARRVRYSNQIKQESTIFAEYQAGRDASDPADDNHFDTWRLTGRNMAVLTGTDAQGREIPAGYFDPVMTGGATNQGIVRYLTEDAVVRPDGSIEPGDPGTPTGSRAPLMNAPELATLAHDPFDRQQMTATTIMQSAKVTEPTGTALMTFGGWGADDGIVISTEFAGQHQIRGAGGQLRNLVVGDKISDLHGNKGVVSLIVDRDMDPDQAADQDIGTEVRWFQANPDLDVVMSPFSLISRRNAGSARELMDATRAGLTPSDPGARWVLRDPDGKPGLYGGIGQMRFIVTHMAVDEKTKVYDDEAVQSGMGRKASSQLAWALQSADTPAIMREFYGHNSGAEANLREYLLCTGLDLEADGTVRAVGGDRSALDDRPERRLLEMPPLVVTAAKTPSLHTVAMRKSFGELIGDKGGDLEIPFPLAYPTGEATEPATGVSWRLPVLSSHLRSGQEFDDAVSVLHDYTRHYQDVHIEACRYRFARQRVENENLTPQVRDELVAKMAENLQRAQRAFDAINSDIQHRVLSGKNNIFKTGLMSSRLSDSATMVWTADPRLDVDQISLSAVKAEQLGLTDGDHALVWRDPVLRDSGVRYLRVAIDNRLTGAAINPVMAQTFDGDFDGDAVAVVKLHTPAAKREAMARFSVPANLLDTGVVNADQTHPLGMALALDTQVALSGDPELAEAFGSAIREVNQIEQDRRAFDEATQRELAELDGVLEHGDALQRGNGDAVVERRADLMEAAQHAAAEIRDRRSDVMGELSEAYRAAQRSEFGAALTFTDREAHLASIRQVCVETGAKGGEKHLEDYARNLGEELGKPGISQADQEASMFATAIKAHGTGLGGSYSQRAVRALRGADLKAVLEVTYPVTQSILQAKHDAAEARHKYEMLQGPGRDLWRGRKLQHFGNGVWRVEHAEDGGGPVQATAVEWTEQFIDFYQAADGFNVKVNPAYVERVAAALMDPGTGLIRNLEEDRALQGTLMDRMAYASSAVPVTENFKILVAAARSGESIFDGAKNEQFASAPTRLARQAATSQYDSFEALAASLENGREPEITRDVVKADVMADHEQGAKARRAGRRSAQAVALRSPQPSRPYRPSIDIDYGHGGAQRLEMEG